MRGRKFIENKSALSLFRLALRKLSEKSLLENSLYRHVLTGELWERYEFDRTDQYSFGTGFRTYPYPETSELIQTALNSDMNEEIIGACRLLYRLEFIGIEYREHLVKGMEGQSQNISEKRFALIYEYANLANQGNLREIMNKTNEEIDDDLAFYQDLYHRALELKRKTNANEV